MPLGSVFLDVPPPTPATWVYFSAPLAVALFFLFTRLFYIRNLDLLTLYLFSPGLLLLGEATRLAKEADDAPEAMQELARHHVAVVSLWGYLALFGASLYFLLRCLADLPYVRRPALGANLNLSGLSWLGGSLFLALIAVAAVPAVPEKPTDPVGEAAADAIESALPDVDPLRLLAVLCHLSVAAGLALIGWRHFDD